MRNTFFFIYSTCCENRDIKDSPRYAKDNPPEPRALEAAGSGIPSNSSSPVPTPPVSPRIQRPQEGETLVDDMPASPRA